MGTVFLKTPNYEGIYNAQDKVLMKSNKQIIIFDKVGDYTLRIPAFDQSLGITFETWGPGSKAPDATSNSSASDGGYGGNYMRTFYTGGTNGTEDNFIDFDITVGNGQLFYSVQAPTRIEPKNTSIILCQAYNSFNTIGISLLLYTELIAEYRGGAKGTKVSPNTHGYYGAGAGGGGAGVNGIGQPGDNGDPAATPIHGGQTAEGGAGADGNDGGNGKDSFSNPLGSSGDFGDNPGGGGGGAYKKDGAIKLGGYGGNGKLKITYYI